MGKQLVAGLFWWLATSYFLEFGAGMYGVPHGFGPILGFVIVGGFMAIGARGTILARLQPAAPQLPPRRIARIPGTDTPAAGRRAVNPNG
jgi:hypothetical protein